MAMLAECRGCRTYLTADRTGYCSNCRVHRPRLSSHAAVFVVGALLGGVMVGLVMMQVGG